MINYLIAMAIRIVCILMCFVVHGWWVIIFVVGAVVIPYFAVVLANVSSDRGAVVARPGSIVPVRPYSSATTGPDVPDLDADEASHEETQHPATDSRGGSYAKQPPARGE